MARENPSRIGASWEVVVEGKGGKMKGKRKEKGRGEGGEASMAYGFSGFLERAKGFSSIFKRSPMSF